MGRPEEEDWELRGIVEKTSVGKEREWCVMIPLAVVPETDWRAAWTHSRQTTISSLEQIALGTELSRCCCQRVSAAGEGTQSRAENRAGPEQADKPPEKRKGKFVTVLLKCIVGSVSTWMADGR
jgi:hypothetical protein